MLKPTATVHLPAIATGTDEALLEPGKPRDDAAEWLACLQDEYHVVVVSSIANTLNGARLLLSWLQSNGLPYDDVWLGFGYPLYKVCYADR